jgi:WD40 repeat protein
MSNALAPGTRLGPYEIDSLIGAGGMGQVYRAHDPRLGRNVAIKTVTAGATDPDRLRRFETEARAAGALDHPNLLVVYDTGREGDVPYIVSELLEGETLRARLRAGAISVRQASDYTVQIARGLAAAHASGIVHRDLKPENLFLTRDGRVKILDFGVAKLVGAAQAETRTTITGTGVVVGTAGYMAPEQVRADPVDPRTDIFALGLVMHEMLSGARPFQRDTTAETLAAILNDDAPELPPSVTPSVARIVGRCLEKRPEDRFHSAHDLAIAIELLSTATHAGTTAAVIRAPAVSRRKVLVYGASSLGLIAAGAAGGVWLGGSRGPIAPPSLRRLTFRRGVIRSARVAPDGQTYFASALWDGGPCRVYTGRLDGSESRTLDNLPDGNVLAVSRSGEIALTLGPQNAGLFTYGTLARVPITGGAPREMLEDVKHADWSPDGTELAVIRSVDGVDRLEYPIGTVLVQPAAGDGSGLGFVRISPDGQVVAFVHYRAPQSIRGRVSVVDRAGKVTTLSDQYVNIHGLAWKGDEIYFTAAEDAPLFRAFLAVTLSGTQRTVMRVPTNVTLWDTLPDGRIVFAQTDDHGVMAARLQGDVNERNLSWLDASRVSDISPDGQMLLFTESGQGAGARGASYLRRLDGSPAVRLGNGYAYALSPDKRWVVSAPALARDGTSDYLEIIPTGAGTSQRLPGTGLTYTHARWLSDGKRIVASASEVGRRTRLYLMEQGTSDLKPISPEGIGTWVVSPDGSTIAAISPDARLRLYPVDGSVPRDVPGVDGNETPVGWIPDGLLVMAAVDLALGNIYKVDVTTGRRQLWTNMLPKDPAGMLLLGSVVVTPDGRSLAYSWFRALSNLYVAEGLA